MGRRRLLVAPFAPFLPLALNFGAIVMEKGIKIKTFL
jgi:hypothetical protein